MRRIDFHIHTVASPLDEEFEFNLDSLLTHVGHNSLDAIAITNHNLFDGENFKEICDAVGNSIRVFPGVEVSVKNFHVLAICDPRNVVSLANACAQLPEIRQGDDGISIEEFKRLFGNGSYLVIPHYLKNPRISESDLASLGKLVSGLEVSSQKKWYREYRRTNMPLVMFSDFRCSADRPECLGKYTYVSIEDLEFESLRLAFHDKDKFAIAESEDHFELAPNLFAATGLNVVIGGRSTGKTYFLDSLFSSCDPDDVFYIRQFGIVKDAEEKAFRSKLADEESSIRDDYYEPMNDVIAIMEKLHAKDAVKKSIEDYLNGLTSYAETSAREDEYSRCPIYSGARLPLDNSSAEKKVVNAILTLLDEGPISDDIDRILGRDSLIELLSIAMDHYKKKRLRCKCIELANEIAKKIKEGLKLESSRPPCPESPFIEAAMRNACVKRFAHLRQATKTEAIVGVSAIGNFKRVVKRVPYKDAKALKKAIGTSANLGGMLQLDDVEYVERLLKTEDVSHRDRALFDMSVVLLNENNEEVSGGQKAEYLFFRALDKASSHDVVLIDEPESSFDNPFLNKSIATELKKISRRATVFIATHNNVLGVSIKPDGIVYTSIENGRHRIYSGDASSKKLKTADGAYVDKADVLLELMEAGEEAYKGRKPYYGLA